MSIFILKIIACVSMILDHIKYSFPSTENFFTMYLGRLAMPLFAFVATQGYIHTSDLKKYIKRLFIFSIISQIPFMLFRKLVDEGVLINVIFTLLLGIMTIYAFDKTKNKYLGFAISLIIIVIGELIQVDYGFFGVGLVFLFYLFRDEKITLLFTYISFTFLYYFIRYWNEIILGPSAIYQIIKYFIATVSPIILILLYNGKEGRKLKYFYYWFYPIHMMVLYIIGK